MYSINVKPSLKNQKKTVIAILLISQFAFAMPSYALNAPSTTANSGAVTPGAAADIACDNMNTAAKNGLANAMNAYDTLNDGKPSRYLCLDKWNGLSFSGLLSMLSLAGLIDKVVDAALNAVASIVCKASDTIFNSTVGQLNAIMDKGTLMLPGGIPLVEFKTTMGQPGKSGLTVEEFTLKPDFGTNVNTQKGTVTVNPTLVRGDVVSSTTIPTANVLPSATKAAGTAACSFGRC